MKYWKWQQPSGALWLVETDQEKGTIILRDQNEKVFLVKKDLKSQTVRLIEDEFLSVVATLAESKSKVKARVATADYNPMYG